MKKREKATQQQTLLRVLHKALLLDGDLHFSLYEHELEEHIAYWTDGMKKDKNDFVFVMTENNGYAAMVVITKQEELLVNEEARTFLKGVWKEYYETNIKNLLPHMANDLNDGYFSVNGVNYA